MSSPSPGLEGSGSCLPHRGVPGPGRGTELLHAALGEAGVGLGERGSSGDPSTYPAPSPWAVGCPGTGIPLSSGLLLDRQETPDIADPRPCSGFSSCWFHPGIPRVLVPAGQGGCGAEPVWAAWWEPHWHCARGPLSKGQQQARAFCFPCPLPPLPATSLSPRMLRAVRGAWGRSLHASCSCISHPCTPAVPPASPVGPAVTPVPQPRCSGTSQPSPHPSSSIPHLHSSSSGLFPFSMPPQPRPVPIDCISSQAFPAARGRCRQVRGTRDSGWDTAGGSQSHH